MNNSKIGNFIVKVKGIEYQPVEITIEGTVHQFFVDKDVYEQGQCCPLLTFGTLMQEGSVLIKKDPNK